MKLKPLFSVLLLSIITGMPIILSAGVKEIFRDEFDKYSTKNWGGDKPAGAEIIFRNTLSSTNGALRLNPKKGACYLISQKLYRKASLDVEFKAAKFSDNSTIYYYLGFHNTEPWARDLTWLVIQDNNLKFQCLKDGGKAFQKVIAYLKPEKWYKLQIRRDEKGITVLLNGEKKLVMNDKKFLPNAPMSVFIGANGMDKNNPPDLLVDYVAVSGDAKIVKKLERQLTEKEKKLLNVQQSVTDRNWRGSIANGEIILESEETTLGLSLKHGLQWTKLERRKANSFNFLGLGKSSPVYAVKIGNACFPSQDFPVEKIEFSREKHALTITQVDPAKGVKIIFSIDMHNPNDILMNLQVSNLKNTTRRIGSVFPLLNDLGNKRSQESMSFFFPWRGGLLGKVSSSLAAEYGALANMQIMAVFNEKQNAGLIFFPKDATGTLKGLMLRKNDKEHGIKVKHHELWYPNETPPFKLITGDGIGMACYYFSTDVQPGAYITAPEVRMNIYTGTWKDALKKYVAWANTWYKRNNVPQWFMDTFTILCQHPGSYYSKKKKRYIGSEALTGGEHLTQWAFWEGSKNIPKESRTKAFATYQPGDFKPEPRRGGMKAFRKEIQRYKARKTDFSIYTNFRFCWSDSDIGKKHGKEWASIYSPGGSYTVPPFPKEIYCMCFYETDAWPKYLGETFRTLIKKSGIKAIYLDELGIQMPCYNPAHKHYQQGRYPFSSKDLASSLKLIRDYMKQADPEAALMTEHPGSDWLTQFTDGAWDQTFYIGAFPFVEKYFDENRLCYFRFCFPGFKLAEWGHSKRHPNRYFFNGMGWDSNNGDKELSKRLGQVLRENGNAISTLTPEPLIKTSNPELLANRFDTVDKIIYTMYNKSSKTITGRVLEKAPFEGHYVELVNDIELKNDAKLAIPAETVRGVALLPNAIKLQVKKANVKIMIAPKYRKLQLVVYPQIDDSHLNASRGVAIDIKNGSSEFSIAERFGKKCEKLIFKLMDGTRLIDERILAAE